jgi:hypothetical protein
VNNLNNDNNKKLIDELAELLNDIAKAHHREFAATQCEDPDWSTWYADHLLDKMRQMLNAYTIIGRQRKWIFYSWCILA